MRNTFPKLGFAGKSLIGMDFVKVACQPGKIENVTFAHGPPNCLNLLPNRKFLEIKSGHDYVS
jgi:hypothetical protein